MRRRTVEDWRRVVYRAPLSGNVQVLLLRLADHMRDNRQVSVPRKQLAAELGVHEQRIAERIRAAIDAGYLSKVSGGYRGMTATYQGLFPDCVLKPGTQSEGESIRATSTHSTPEIGTHSTHECVPDGGYATTTADLSPTGRPSDDHAPTSPPLRWWEREPPDGLDLEIPNPNPNPKTPANRRANAYASQEVP